MKLTNKRIIVSGGSSGFGKGLAAELVHRGALVWITARDGVRLAAAARETGATPLVADVTSGAAWDRVFATVGDVDILVNNAGAGIRIAPLAEQTDDEIAAAINTNLTGALLGAARAARHMSVRHQGTIVNVSSVCALHGWPGWSVYTAAKAGLTKFSQTLHAELRPCGVRVICVTPSWGRTDFNRAVGLRGASEDAQSAGQCIQSEEFGRLVADLLELPDHLTVPEIVLQPMIQEIIPM